MSIKGIVIGACVIALMLLFAAMVSCALEHRVWNIDKCDETRCDLCSFPCGKRKPTK